MTDKEKIEAIRKHLKRSFAIENENGEFEEFTFNDKFLDLYSNEQLLKLYEIAEANGVFE